MMSRNSDYEISFVKWKVEDLVAETTGIELNRTRKVCRFFDDGCEVAFIARYRVIETDRMSCDEVRRSYEAWKMAKDLETKVIKAVKSIEQKAEGEELKNAIESLSQARDSAEIGIVTRQFTSKQKTTKAGVARELGLESIAHDIFRAKAVNLLKYVNGKELKDVKSVEMHVSNLLADFINKDQNTVNAVQRIAQFETIDVPIQVKCSLSKEAKKVADDVEKKLLSENDRFYQEILNFKNYHEFSFRANRIGDHQILALERGAERNVLKWSLEIDAIKAAEKHPLRYHQIHPNHANLYKSAFDDSVKRLFVPRLERAVSRFLINRAERGAISCFAQNLRQLFAQAPLSGYHIIALDPGFKMCKLAFLTPYGEVIDTMESSFWGNDFSNVCVNQLNKWCNELKGAPVVVAIGNGHASKETQRAMSKLIQERRLVGGKMSIHFCVVPETGASKYSVTKLAEDEFPTMPPTLRSAVSIGRRLLDPMGEYVKIEPQHLGMGMYQHSVPEKRLAEELNESVREAVSLRGVNVNTASIHLLRQICGLNKTTAQGIVDLRKKGPIIHREDLKKVRGLGEKAFEQCAGFLMIHANDLPADCLDDGHADDGPPKKRGRKQKYDPFDSTMVHPSQYEIAKNLLDRFRIDPKEILTESTKEYLKKLSNLNDQEEVVRDLLLAEQVFTPPPPLLKELRSIGSLSSGQCFMGRVMNNTDFGTFVDIGAERDGLIYKEKQGMTRPKEAKIKSKEDDRPPVGSMIRVMINEVDTRRGRISLRQVQMETNAQIRR